MDSATINRFSAAPSLLGYLFQCRYALLESLRRLGDGPQFVVSLETLDDIVFERNGEPPELLQTKHHVDRVADLTDGSVDLWKTLRIWCEQHITRALPAGSVLFLITTGIAPSGSAAHYLRADTNQRDPKKAHDRLLATASSSTNKTNEAGYAAFRSVPLDERTTLCGSVFVADAAPTIVDLDASLRKTMFFAVRQDHLDHFLQRLEGWWYRRALRQLTAASALPIMSEELQDEIAELREQFKQDNLPIDEDILTAVVDATGYQDTTFVRQLKLIEISYQRILIAIRNYFRAFQQRSRWVRDELLMVGELDRYEDRIVEEWEVLFEQMHDELGVESAEEAKKQAAQALYKWAESGSLPNIRPGCTEPFVARGTCHILADRRRVGWHPDYAELLQRLLEPEGPAQ